MIELHKKYKPGQRTFVYLIFKLAWLFVGLAIACIYVAFKMSFGSYRAPVEQFLASKPDWLIDVTMLTQWALCFAVALILIGLIRVSVHYRWHSFHVDDNAFHLRKGMVRVQEITIPYRQISNVHIEQPYHWRLFGLAQLDVTMTSSRTSLRTKKRDFLIPVIDKSLARELSHFLIKQASGDTDEEDDDELEDEEDGEDIEVAAHI